MAVTPSCMKSRNIERAGKPSLNNAAHNGQSVRCSQILITTRPFCS
jgi:hypothetical protein